MRAGLTGGLLIIVALGAAVAFLLLPEEAPIPPRTADVTVELANRDAVVCGFPEWGSTNQSPTVRGTLPYVVACAEQAEKTHRLAIEAAGARVIGFFPPNAFQVEASREVLRRLSSDPRFAAATEFLPGDKIDGRLFDALRDGADTVEVAVVSLSSEDRDAVRAYVTSHGGDFLRGCLHGPDLFHARLPAALVGELAKRGDVRWMEPFARPKLLNDLAAEPAAMNVREIWDMHGLSGANQVVSTSDSGVDTGDVATMHRDLADRVCGIGVVTDCSPTDLNGHGTHTAGSIVGNGTMSDGVIRGMAWGAKLWVWSCADRDGNIYMPETCQELFRPDQGNWPTFIHSASWGEDTGGVYDSQCEEIDRYVWEHPDFLPVIANGNAGYNDKIGLSIAQSVGSPAVAKNVLAVGAVQNARRGTFGGWVSGSPTTTAQYSSRGPCQDGRIKPDVAAPGTGILSTRAYGCSYGFGIGQNTNYAYNCGTSMAAPLVAGAAALVREWLVDRCGFTNEVPSAALMKAVITGGAKGVSEPDNDQGWGRVDLEETLFPSNRAVKLVDRIPFAVGTNFSYVVETTNTAPFDVQLVWIDTPASFGGRRTSACLNNDLDLSVEALVDAERVVWHGNGGASADERNTVESVRIGAAPPMKYRIAVTCKRIVKDHTDGGAAALYIRGAFDPRAEPSDLDSVTVSVSVEASGATAEVSPAPGLLRVLKGQRIDFAASEWAYEHSPKGTPILRRAFLGFAGSGDAASSGKDRSFSVVVSNDTSVVWNYDSVVSDYFFRYIANLDGVGSLLVAEDWRKGDLHFSLKFPEEAALGETYRYTGWYLSGWRRTYGTHEFRLGTVCYARTDEDNGLYLVDAQDGRLCESIEITMDEGVDLWCFYYNATENRSDGLPYWWYMRYLWGGESFLGYDGSVNGDPDGDGFSNKAEYDNGTDPVDDASFRFKIDDFSLSEMRFTGSVKGKLIVERCDHLDGSWRGVSTNLPPRASTINAVRLDEDESSSGYYRVIYQNE